MKIKFIFEIYGAIFLLAINHLLSYLTVGNLKIKSKVSDLEMLKNTNNLKLSENLITNNKNNDKIKVYEKKYKNFTLELENSLSNFKLYRKFLEEAIISLENLPLNSTNEKPIFDIIEKNKLNILKEKSINLPI